MNRCQAIAITLAATALTAPAAPRVALIRVKDVYSGLPSTAALQEEIKKEREAIMKDQRVDGLRRILNELQSLQARLSDKAKPLDEETSRQLARSYELKRQEAQTLQKEFESFRAEQDKRINRKMVIGMRTSLEKIMETSRKIAGEQGYDLVLDASGNTNTGVAFVIHNKNSPDLTDTVKAALQDADQPKPAAAPPKAAESPDH